MRFRDRAHAGGLLGSRLLEYQRRDDVVVLALPRGGVPVAAEVAKLLEVPLDVFPVRKVGVPGQEELALGAVASGGVRVLNDAVAGAARLDAGDIEALAAREERELARQEESFRGGRPAVSPHGLVAILVDDGLATGASMRAAIAAVRAHGPAKVVVAVPVGASPTLAALTREVDDVVVLEAPRRFLAVGYWYEDFSPTTDDEVRRLLAG